MNEFVLYNVINSRYKVTSPKVISTIDNVISKEKECIHIDSIIEKNKKVCLECGMEIKTTMDIKQPRYNQNSKGSNPCRLQIRTSDEKSIYKDVLNMGFSHNIISDANKIYHEVTKGKIYRGNSRKSIIFACIFYSFKNSGDPQSHERLIQMFKLNKKSGLKGLKHINLNLPKNSKILIRSTYITPKHIIIDILNIFSANESHINEVLDIYKSIQNRSSRLNRARPQSIAAGVVFFWMKKNNKDITIKQYSKKVKLSELTINKIIKEINSIFE